MFRTDLGDDERNNKEWNHGRVDENTDPAGDDDVDFIITESSQLDVKYKNNN